MRLRDPKIPSTSSSSQASRLWLASTQPQVAEPVMPQRDEAMRLAPEPIMVSDTQRRVVYVNPAFEALTGYSAEELVGRACGFLRGPDTCPEVQQEMREAIAAGRPFRGDLLNYRKDGTAFWNEVTVLPVFDAAGELVQFVATQHDVSARHIANDELLLATRVFEEGGEAMMITDANQRIVKVNSAFTASSGYPEADLIGQGPGILGSDRHDPSFYLEMWREASASGYWQGEVWSRRKNGSVHPQYLVLRRVVGGKGQTTHFVASFSDLTERKAAEERIWRLANYDSLTELPNRAFLRERAARLLEQAGQDGQPLAFLFLDLDHFKKVNDSLGHAVGDRLLVELANRLCSELREQDILGRVGGDEFVLLLPGASATEAAQVVRRLQELVSRPFVVGSQELMITSSAGIAMFPFDGADFDTLASRAEVAMYRTKELGRDAFCFFTAEMQAQCTRALLLDNLLRRAIERGEFSLQFQPQCSLKDGTLTGVEALLRWNSGELGPVSPVEFIPIAESSGLIVPIGDWVLRTALEQMRQWIDQDIAPPQVAVNLSVVQFRQPGFPDHVRGLLEEAGVSPCRLELELTESVASDDPTGAMAVMDALHAHGIGLSIDDFGTGYSSLSYLKRFKVGKLKIDRSFVSNVTDSAADQAIVSTIIRLANGLGMVTIAEGVETPAQLEALRQRGCDQVQGYWIARPFPPEDLPVYREAHAGSQSLLQPRRQSIHSRWTRRRRSAR